MNLLEKLSRRQKSLMMLACDLLLLPLSFYTAVCLRESSFFPEQIDDYYWLFFVAPIIAIPIFIRMGLYRAVLRYADDRLLKTVVAGVTISVLGLGLIVAIFRVISLPRTSLVIYFVLAVTYIGTSRWAARSLIRGFEVKRKFRDRKNLAIFGAGQAGTQIARALMNSPEFLPVAFFDDSKEAQGSIVGGIRVYSDEQVDKVVKKHGIEALLLAIPSASRSRRQQILQKFESYGIEMKTLPGLTELVQGKVQVQDIREVGIEDLLGRDAVPPKMDLLGKCITGKNVMVTGAGGSIGSQLCRQVADLNPACLVLFEVSEYNLYKIEMEIRSRNKDLRIVSILGDVTDALTLDRVIQKHGIHTIYHAAAYKHVPLVEANPVAGVWNNVFGTLTAAQSAFNADVESFILISTDKAVRPTNVMGATKRLAELILQGLHETGRSKTCFSMVRFGNVLGSSGSVVPLFKEQIQKGGPITVTHPEITRFFMTIPEAVQLVLQAAAMGQGGDVFILDMGDPVRISDLAKKMIHLSGLSEKGPRNPDGDIEIVYSGLRPGEKLFEELLIGENVYGTDHPRIWKAKEQHLPWDKLTQDLESLRSDIRAGDAEAVKSWMRRLVREYQTGEVIFQ